MEVPTITWTLGDRLAKARRQAHVSTAAMATALGVSRKTINNYESDRVPVRAAMVRVWAQQCNVPYEWLTQDEGLPEQVDPSILWSTAFASSAA